MSKQIKLPIVALVVLPFRAEVDPLRATIVCTSTSQPTTFELGYQDAFRLHPTTAEVKATALTFVSVETQFPYPEGSPEPDVDWFHNQHAVRIIDENVLPRLNDFLLRVRRAATHVSGNELIRSFGALDLVFVSLQFRGATVFSRGNANLFASMRNSSGSPRTIDPALLSTPVPHEWAVLVRAVDLVNHGYFREGVVVSFALLDASVQNFLNARLREKGLTPEHASDFLRSIESQRLRRYLELVLPVLGMPSPLCDAKLAAELKWLNTTRNEVMHGGHECTLGEAQRGIRAVLSLLHALNDCGASYVLPDRLPFWSGPT